MLYNKEESSSEAERLSIVGTSAEILRQDIRTEICKTHLYPPTSLCIPDSLIFCGRTAKNQKRTIKADENSMYYCMLYNYGRTASSILSIPSKTWTN